ncbi:MAG: hypothetical protein HYS38_05930 [Acidobacteria bacterium]|nr:hypothetical protein [Acidobacteriota bacterium]
MRVSMWPGIALLVGGTVCAWLAWPASAQAQSSCSPSSPAAISGSTGVQGLLDPTNTNASLGVVWPTNASTAFIFLDTGQAEFYNLSGTLLSTTTLPGVSGSPPFPDGKLHFTSIHLPGGKTVIFHNGLVNSGQLSPFPSRSQLPSLPLPIIVLSCQDVIVDQGAILGAGTSLFPGFQAGFGPRSGSLPATASLYPPIGGGGGASDVGNVNGGQGGAAFVVAAAQRITVNGTVSAPGFSALLGGIAAQGGGGGSVRLTAVLIEGTGSILTAGGTGSGGVSSPNGPSEIQAFLQDLFTGTASTTPIRSNPVVAPIPDNLPTIDITGVGVSDAAGSIEYCNSACPNTGSLSTPDVSLPPASTPVTVTVKASTAGVPNGTSLTFRAVGTNGTASTATVAVGGPECPVPGPTIACATLTLNPGATYQIVVYPSTAFALANLNSRPVPMSTEEFYAGLRQDVADETKVAAANPVAEKPSETRVLSPLEKWARVFGVDPEAHQKMAQLKTAP